ncbi:hypothetical protein C0Q70_19916 [Pomacea canaliculata]|uniref:Uncharacterized protein n=1 Tax=Pomacea canaliculata TaxID=400727 RepID=A0A2T7NE31_POMCA|nr:hypothetical protein C0Q70_19916 [Pomacea canaliculata]
MIETYQLAPSVFSEMEKDLPHTDPGRLEKNVQQGMTIFLRFFLSFPSRRAHACDLQKNKHKLQSPPASHESIRLAKLQFYLREVWCRSAYLRERDGAQLFSNSLQHFTVCSSGRRHMLIPNFINH